MNRTFRYDLRLIACLLCAALTGGGCFLFSTAYWSDPVEFPDLSDLTPIGELDPEWTFTSLEGEEISFGDFAGKVLFVTVWGTWCGACRSAMPSVQRLYDSMSNTGVAFVLLSEQETSTVRDFKETNGYTFPAYVYEGRLPDILRTPATPTTYIVDRRGRVVFSHIGAARWDTQQCKHFLYDLLN